MRTLKLYLFSRACAHAHNDSAPGPPQTVRIFVPDASCVRACARLEFESWGGSVYVSSILSVGSAIWFTANQSASYTSSHFFAFSRFSPSFSRYCCRQRMRGGGPHPLVGWVRRRFKSGGSVMATLPHPICSTCRDILSASRNSIGAQRKRKARVASMARILAVDECPASLRTHLIKSLRTLDEV